ncbi:DUF4181 domain-containing protein [Paenibacillus lautus]|jgi:hypothetical protein|uniref:DUF4181 domain-containing protein n=1 Tax=Paenibacillus lautus TaxID=1401 RepID=UPI0027D8EFF1|nr:DUF4181 domain-containing protein [Paenibacillus lautus]
MIMEGLYSFIILVICVGPWVLSKIIDVGEEEMRDTPVYKWYLLGSWALLLPILILVWTMDRSRPYPILPFLLSGIFCFRGYMEWKYIRETRRHQVSILLAAASLCFTGLMILILLLKY